MAIINNTSTEIGDVIQIKGVALLEGLVILEEVIDTTIGETQDRFFRKRFRVSTDLGLTFSDWLELNNANINGFKIDASLSNEAVIEYEYERAGTDATGVLAFNQVRLIDRISRSGFGKLFKLINDLYPTGKAFVIPALSNRYKFYTAVANFFNDVYLDITALTSQILSDNENFDAQDAARWESILGLQRNSVLSLEQRRQAILRKYTSPRNVTGRSAAVFLEQQLQLAGFNVFVHENRFDDGSGGIESRSFEQVVGVQNSAVYADSSTYGSRTYGQTNRQLIVNSLESSIDNQHPLFGNNNRTFFIGAQTVGQFVSLPATREQEFRELVLTIKPVNSIAYSLINYT